MNLMATKSLAEAATSLEMSAIFSRYLYLHNFDPSLKPFHNLDYLHQLPEMHLVVVTALALAFPAAVNAGSVIAYFCSSGPFGRAQSVSIHVYYNNKDDGCENLSTFDARTGVTTPLFAYKKFCGDNGFCANVEVFGKEGYHIILDGKDVALGAPDHHQEGYNAITTDVFCEDMKKFDRLYLSTSSWFHVPKTKCK